MLDRDSLEGQISFLSDTIRRSKGIQKTCQLAGTRSLGPEFEVGLAMDFCQVDLSEKRDP